MLKRILLGLLLLIIAAATGIFIYLRSLLPDYNAELKLEGLKAPVEVLYDDYGIPHIYAQNEDDLFRAFGYVHAQDRLFQMEILRRLADGRLAEVFGEKALPSDKFFRTLSFREHARQNAVNSYQDTTEPYVRAARAYVNGINAFIRSGKTPLEFTLAGIPKTPFTPEDLEIIVGYMGYTFLGAFKTESVATAIYSTLGPSYFHDIFSGWPDSTFRIPVQPRENAGAANLIAQMSGQLDQLADNLPYPPFTGSNGWVISGRKTRSGKPILANDTHIAYAQPSVWYEAHLECPGFRIYGNFLAGTPVPALGHSDKGGWGLTMFENDDADFFREKANPENPGQVWYKDHWEDMQVRKETIRIKGKPDLAFDVKKSRHGYILNGAFDALNEYKDPVSLWWIYHQFPSRHLQVFYNLSHAGNATEAAFAVKPLTSPGLNVMWADTAGNIAWWAAGKIPVRPPHVNPNLILDGSTGLDDPTGWLDFSKNPQILNPDRGVLYTANNQPDDMGTGLVAGYYVPSNRAQRIEELLFTDKQDWTEEELRRVINDVKSSAYVGLLKKILPVITRKELFPTAQKSFDLLAAWDGSHGLTNPEPAIYYRFLFQAYRNTLEDELGPELFRAFDNSLTLKRNTASLFSNDLSPWWDDKKTPQKESRSQILTRSLNEAATALEKQLGGQPENWQWMNVHTIEHKHPMGILPVAGSLFNVGPIPVPGGRETINNLDFDIDSSGMYKVTYGPALRRIIDFGYPSGAYSVNPTGQSGYFMSKHYDDQAQMFAEGGKRPELTSRPDIEKVKTGRTLFRP
jgi:penicillin amidase